MKPYLVYLLCFSLTLSFSVPLAAQVKRGPQVKTIVIDPGHGGEQAGCVYGSYLEKNVVLSVALKLGELINKSLPDVKVVYTRKTDISVGLAERADIANKANADLFISIHANAGATRNATSARGSLTLIMGVDHLDKNFDVAMRENNAITYEEDYSTKYEGFDPESTESYIMFSLMQYAFIQQSLSLANSIQKHYGNHTPIPTKRGVRQQPLLVLWRTTMPGVLTELGFLSNSEDRKYISSESGQKNLATALFNAISEYKSSIEGNTNVVQILNEAPVEDNNTTPAVVGSKITFRVQVSASAKNVNTTTDATYKPYKDVTVIKSGNLYKYFIGNDNSYKTAVERQRTLTKKFKNAFVVAFEGDKQITITDELKKK